MALSLGQGKGHGRRVGLGAGRGCMEDEGRVPHLGVLGLGHRGEGKGRVDQCMDRVMN